MRKRQRGKNRWREEEGMTDRRREAESKMSSTGRERRGEGEV